MCVFFVYPYFFFFFFNVVAIRAKLATHFFSFLFFFFRCFSFSVFWDLYCAAPERRDTCDHSSEAKAFHDYVSLFFFFYLFIYVIYIYIFPILVTSLSLENVGEVKNLFSDPSQHPPHNYFLKFIYLFIVTF